MNNNEINQMSNEILKELFHQIMTIQEKFVEDSSNLTISSKRGRHAGLVER